MKDTLLLFCILVMVGFVTLALNDFGDPLVDSRRPIANEAIKQIEDFRRRTIPSPVPDTPLEVPTLKGPFFQLDPPGPRRDGAGTAFAVRKFGWFMTARHVVGDCDRVGILTDDRRIVTASEVILSSLADLALVRSPYYSLPLPIGRPELRYGQSGFGYGFPSAKWGQVQASLLGRARVRGGRARDPIEHVLVWSIREMPASGLGGMSGGPMLDASGTVVGVHNSENLRRGRLFTVAPVNVNAMLEKNNLSKDDLPGLGFYLEGLNESRYVRVGERLRVRGRVALVLCDVKDDDRIKGWQ